MLFSTRSSVYVPLLGEGQPNHDNSESPFNPKQRPARAIPWTLVVVVACTLLNVALNLFPAFLARHKETPPVDRIITRQNIHLLRRPNQYVGFDAIPWPSPPLHRELSTFPTLLTLVDAASPETVFEDDFAAGMVHTGTITPDDRIVRVTPTISTIVQFRAIDWGMETCELHIDLPEVFGQPGHPGALALYRLNATVPLDSAQLAYATRPSRVAKIAHVPLGEGDVHWHRRFGCATDDVLSFELACLGAAEFGGDEGCFVEWVQIKDALPAIHMKQYATK